MNIISKLIALFNSSDPDYVRYEESRQDAQALLNRLAPSIK